MALKINKKKILEYLKKIDSGLAHHTKKYSLYCFGGTALIMRGIKYISYDLDFVVSQEDFVAISTVTAQIENREKIRIDLMRAGENVNYILRHYKRYAKKFGLFKNLNVFVLDEVDLVLTKILAGRPKDFHDIKDIKINKDDLIERFSQLEIKEGKEAELLKKLNKYINQLKIL